MRVRMPRICAYACPYLTSDTSETSEKQALVLQMIKAGICKDLKLWLSKKVMRFVVSPSTCLTFNDLKVNCTGIDAINKLLAKYLLQNVTIFVARGV